jgi:hypothetical protein
MTPELIALIIYAIDRGIELYEKQGMTKEQIKADVINQIKIYTDIKTQLNSELEKYGDK